MSLSWIAAQPRIDEPSMPKPSSNEDAASCSVGKEIWCQSPGRSVKRRSSILAPFFCANSRTNLGSVWMAGMIRRFLRSVKINARLWPEEIDCFYRGDKADLLAEHGASPGRFLGIA